MPINFDDHGPHEPHPHPGRHKSPDNPPPGTTEADAIRLGGLIQAAANDAAMTARLSGQPEQTTGLTQAQLGLLLFDDGTASRDQITRALRIRVVMFKEQGLLDRFGLMCACG
jgi:hypothetical protein